MQYFLLTGIILSVFHAFVLFTKNDKVIADYILAFWFCLSSVPLFSYYLVYTEKYLNYPSLTVLGMALPLATGPLLYLYTKYTTKYMVFNKADLLHFTPVVTISFFFGSYYFLPFETRSFILKNEGIGYETHLLIKLIAIYISGLIYIPLTLIKLLKYKVNLNNQFSNTERINFNWLLYQIIGMAIVWIVILFIQDDRFIFGSVSSFIIWMSYFGSKQVNVFNQNYKLTQKSIGNTIIEPTLLRQPIENEKLTKIIYEIAGNEIANDKQKSKYQKSTLNESSILRIHESLQIIMQTAKLFKNAELTLDDLATSLNVSPNHLSQIINSIENKNFYDYINKLRVDEFMKLIDMVENQKFTLLSLAFECGFNSKTSFNRNFKKVTGFTPSEYLNQKI